MNQKKTGIILTYLGHGITIISGLFYTPIMLSLLGQEEFGLYQLVASVVSYLSILSLGFTSAYIRFYTRFKEQREDKRIARLNGMFMIIFLGISCICMICGVWILCNLRFVFGSGLSIQELEKTKILLILLVINMALTFPSSVYTCHIVAREKFIFQKVLVVLQALLNPLISIPLLLAGYGSVAIVWVATILTSCKLICNFLFCIKKLHMKFDFTNFSFCLLKEMWGFTVYIFINMIVDQVIWNIDKFLIGRYCGTKEVAVYGVAAQLNSLYIRMSTAVSAVYVPEVNRLVEKEKWKKLDVLFSKVGRMQAMILCWILGIYIIFGKTFIILWAGYAYVRSYYIGLLLIIPVTVPLMQNIGIEIQRAMNKHKVRSIVYFMIAIANVIISIPLIKVYQGVGAAIGTAIALILGNVIFINLYYWKALKIQIPSFWKNISQLLISIIPAFIVGVGYHFLFLKQITIYFFMFGIILFSICYLCGIWFSGMNEAEKKSIVASIKIFKTLLIRQKITKKDGMK